MPKVIMPDRLTAENGAKKALIGEFSESTVVICDECEGTGQGDVGTGFGNDHPCAACNGQGTIFQRVPVSWTTIKYIYAKAVDLLGEPVRGDKI